MMSIDTQLVKTRFLNSPTGSVSGGWGSKPLPVPILRVEDAFMTCPFPFYVAQPPPAVSFQGDCPAGWAKGGVPTFIGAGSERGRTVAAGFMPAGRAADLHKAHP